jgi:hypothetical protein
MQTEDKNQGTTSRRRTVHIIFLVADTEEIRGKDVNVHR